MSKRNGSSSAAERIVDAESDAGLLEQLDELVMSATKGDRRAVGVIAIVFGPPLNDEAREALGPKYAQNSADVLQDLFLGMCEEKLVFPAIRGAALPWLKRMVREIATKYVKEREPPGGMAG